MASYIPLTKGAVAIVDDEDYEWLSMYRWYADSSGYAARDCRNGRKDTNTAHTILMHRLILNSPQNMQVDHINGNRVDNRRSNLRILTNQQNSFNRKCLKKNKTSKFKGVSWQKQRKNWRAAIMVNGRSKHLGAFESEFEAAIIYDCAARQYFGEYAKTNFPLEGGDSNGGTREIISIKCESLDALYASTRVGSSVPG